MKFYGKIGYGKTVETEPGISAEIFEEHDYFGDVTKSGGRFSSADKVNDDFGITNEFSIIADSYALDNFSFMKYIEYLNTKWKITDIEVQYPRLLIRVGGVFNG